MLATHAAQAAQLPYTPTPEAVMTSVPPVFEVLPKDFPARALCLTGSTFLVAERISGPAYPCGFRVYMASMPEPHKWWSFLYKEDGERFIKDTEAFWDIGNEGEPADIVAEAQRLAEISDTSIAGWAVFYRYTAKAERLIQTLTNILAASDVSPEEAAVLAGKILADLEGIAADLLEGIRQGKN